MDEIGFRSLSGDAYPMCEWQPPAKTDTQLILNDPVACELLTHVRASLEINGRYFELAEPNLQ